MAFQSYTVNSSSSLTTSLTVNVPSGVVNGDELIAAFMHVSPSVSVTWPAGWGVDIITLTPPPGDGACSVRSRIANTEPASYTWTIPGAGDSYVLGVILRYTTTTTLLQSAVTTGGNGAPPQTETTPAITPAVNSARILYIYEGFQNLSIVNDPGATHTPDPATALRVLEKVSSPTNIHSIVVCDELDPGGSRSLVYSGGNVSSIGHESGYIAFTTADNASDHWAWAEGLDAMSSWEYRS